MIESSIYQIYYSEQTRSELDPGFLPLDNLANNRPDWREYWPIRRFLLEQKLDPDRYYGFFSPKFRSKTGMTAAAVSDFIAQHRGVADVISFSPFFDYMAFPLNIMEQSAADHNCRDLFAQCAALIAPQFQIERSVMTSLDIIYCNYFVAKPSFWTEWLRNCEYIFDLAEKGLTPLGQALSRVVVYGTASAPAKVFVIERVASLILWSQRQWVVKSYNPMLLPTVSEKLRRIASTMDLMVLDALKIAHVRSGAEQYLDLYRQLRERLLARTSTSEHSTTDRQPQLRVSESAHRNAETSFAGQ